MQDRSVWDAMIANHPSADVSYEGFLPTDDLQPRSVDVRRS
jgi:hypothetical protein